MLTLKCDNPLCGKTFLFKGGKSHFHRSSQHFCCRGCQNTVHGQAGTPRHKMWEWIKGRAKRRGTVFTLSLEDIPEIPSHCPILGIPLCPNDKAGPQDSSPSLDRLHPDLGYVAGNVRIISHRANRLRSDATLKELKLLVLDQECVERGRKP
jgi:hypothetical protein